MVEESNHAARRIYRDLGLRYRAVSAAAVPGAKHRSSPP